MENNNLKGVSIVIPLFNKENYIARALRSIYSQSYSNYEVIVVNDGSTDESEKIVKSLCGPRTRLITQVNSGVSSARNWGIQYANFEHIAFLDADDEWLPDFLDTVISLYRKYPYAGLWATAYKIVRSNEEELITIDEPSVVKGSNGEYIIDIFKGHPYYKYFWTSSVMTTKSKLEEVGKFPIYYRLSQDTYVWHRIAHCSQVAFCSKIKSIYYMNATNHAFANKDTIKTGVDPRVTAFYDYNCESNEKVELQDHVVKSLRRYVKYSIAENALFARRVSIKDITMICRRVQIFRKYLVLCSTAKIISYLPTCLKFTMYNSLRILFSKKVKIPVEQSRYPEGKTNCSIFKMNNCLAD